MYNIGVYVQLTARQTFHHIYELSKISQHKIIKDIYILSNGFVIIKQFPRSDIHVWIGKTKTAFLM